MADKSTILKETLKENGYEEFITEGSGFWLTILEAMETYSEQNK